MAVSLSKGSSVSLTKESGPVRLARVLVGLGWDALGAHGVTCDLDASAFLLGAAGRVLADSDFVFYGNLDSTSGAVHHNGDNITGEGEGDDEQITVDLDSISPAVQSIAFTVTIHEAEVKGQNFGQVHGAFIRVANSDNDVELARFDLTSGASAATAFIFGELYRDGSEWRFSAVGDEAPGGLAGVARSFGVNVG